MPHDYLLALRTKPRVIQAVMEYLADKPSNKASLTELFINAPKTFQVHEDEPPSYASLLLFGKEFFNQLVSINNSSKLDFFHIPTDIRIQEAKIELKLITHLYDRGCFDMIASEKELLPDSSLLKLKTTLELTNYGKLTGLIEVVSFFDEDVEPEEPVMALDEEWPKDGFIIEG